jgi:hypothetical protein
MNKVANGKLEMYKGWKRVIDSTNNIMVNKVTGEEVVITSPSIIGKKYHIDVSHLSKLLSGKRDSCGDWEIKNRVIIHRPVKGKVYHLVSPDGRSVKINNLMLFAQKNNLDHNALHEVINGERNIHKGWIRYGSTHNDIQERRQERYNNQAKQYPIFIDPDGKEISIFNMNRFCRNNGLTKQNMLKVVKGIYKQHKGWRLKDIPQDIE